MIKNDCNIVRDLMPLVQDHVASEESREMLETHIATCEKCRKQYENMKATIPEESRKEYEEEQQDFVDALKAIRMRKRKRTAKLLLLVFSVVLVAVFGAGFLFSRINREVIPIDNSKYTITLSGLKNGMIAATIDLQEDVRVNGITGETVPGEKQIGYIYLSVSSGQNGQEWKNIDKNVFTFWLESDPPDEIRQGTAQNYITIWKKGDFLPRALPETEAIWEGTPAQQ